MKFETSSFETTLGGDGIELMVVTYLRCGTWVSEIEAPGRYYRVDTGDFKVLSTTGDDKPFVQYYGHRSEAERGHRHLVLRLERGELELDLSPIADRDWVDPREEAASRLLDECYTGSEPEI